MSDSYAPIARFYDRWIGERDEVPIIIKLLRNAGVPGKELLELACGTGAILAPLSRTYDVWGVDRSAEMLAVARQCVDHAVVYQDDITKVSLERKFDVVICVFNSLNHLLRFSEWRKVFEVARRHLRPGGVFLFDMNTERALRDYIREGTLVEEVGENVLVTEYCAGQRDIMNIEVRVFEADGRGRFIQHQTTIRERAFPITQVREALERIFADVRSHDPELGRVSSASEIVYFVCRR